MELNIYTDGSARDVPNKDGIKERHAGWGFWGHLADDVNKDLYGYGPIGKDGTNNQGELKAAVMPINIAVGLGCKKLNLFMDSSYVKDGAEKNIVKWMKNGWKTKVGEPVKNQQYWKDFVQADKRAQKAGMEITYTWVKGHSGVDGNERADAFAVKGAYASGVGGEEILALGKFGKEDTRHLEKDAIQTKPKKKEKVPLKDPLVVGTRIITLTNTPSFTSTREIDGEPMNVVYSTKYPADVKVLDRELGVEGADCTQCVTLTKTKDFQLELVKEKLTSIEKADMVIPVVNYWDKLSSTALRKKMHVGEVELLTRDDIVYYIGEQRDRDTKLMMPIDVPVARIAKLPRRAWSAIEHFETKYSTLMFFMNGEVSEDDIIEITDRFITTEEVKNKVKLIPNPDIKGKTDINIDGWYGHKINLCAMIDMINPASINTILKTHEDVKFYIIKHDENDVQFKFSFVAKSSNGAMLMNNPYTNIIFKK